MLRKFFGVILSICFIINFNGCAAMQARTGNDEINQFGHVYSATQLSIAVWPNIYRAKNISLYEKISGTPLALIFLLPDLAISVVTDTLLLPVEIFVKSKNRRLTISESSDLWDSASMCYVGICESIETIWRKKGCDDAKQGLPKQRESSSYLSGYNECSTTQQTKTSK